MGVGYRRIAEQVGYQGPSGAFQAVESALKKTISEPSDALRQLELERLDTLQMAAWPLAVGGQVGAIERVLKVIERRAKLLGLDHPIQYTLDDIRSIASKVHAVVRSEVEDEAIREKIFSALGFTEGDKL